MSAREKQNEMFFKEKQCKNEDEVEKLYVNMEKKSNAIDGMLKRESRESEMNFQSSYLQNVSKTT